MPTRFLTVLAAMAFVAAPAANSQVTADNVRAVQRSGTKLVDIDFDIIGFANPVDVSLEISADGGTTWAVPATTMTGSIGPNITPGNNLRLTWNAGVDWNHEISTLMRFRIKVNDFAFIPAGSFSMGDPLDGITDAPPHPVNVSAFYMGRYEVTKALWDDVRAWGLQHGYPDLAVGSGKAAGHPVQTVTWYDMVKWCNARSEKESLTPCYYTDTAQTTVYRIGDTYLGSTMVKWSANGYRLPTEAEWEKAARGGLAGRRFPWGDTISESQANYFGFGWVNNAYCTYDLGPHGNNFIGSIGGTYPYTSPVGSFAANGYGLYDMTGNVWEWCWDIYGAYPSTLQTDPRGAETGSIRMYKGGGWSSDAADSRVAHRHRYHGPSYKYIRIGFRLARSSVQ